MPDFDARSSASFISSKEGGMPLSFIRSWMNISSSCCLRVSIGPKPQNRNIDGTTIRVPVMFCNTGGKVFAIGQLGPRRGGPAGQAQRRRWSLEGVDGEHFDICAGGLAGIVL